MPGPTPLTTLFSTLSQSTVAYSNDDTPNPTSASIFSDDGDDVTVVNNPTPPGTAPISLSLFTDSFNPPHPLHASSPATSRSLPRSQSILGGLRLRLFGSARTSPSPVTSVINDDAADNGDVESLRRRVRELEAKVETLEKKRKEDAKTIDDLRANSRRRR